MADGSGLAPVSAQLPTFRCDSRPDWANGSELDAAYAVVHDGILYLVLAGNLETNWNKIEIFFDTIPGQGQNPLLGAENPDIDYGALQRMGAINDPEFLPGLAFATGFSPDYYVTVGAGGNPTAVHVSYAELYVDELNVGVGYYLGWDVSVPQECRATGPRTDRSRVQSLSRV